jgi:hypothetical protein
MAKAVAVGPGMLRGSIAHLKMKYDGNMRGMGVSALHDTSRSCRP